MKLYDVNVLAPREKGQRKAWLYAFVAMAEDAEQAKAVVRENYPGFCAGATMDAHPRYFSCVKVSTSRV